jgi:hypothetical protein
LAGKQAIDDGKLILHSLQVSIRSFQSPRFEDS